jgi:hypothetical protein
VEISAFVIWGTYENWEEKEEKCERKRKKARQKITGNRA